MRVLTALACFLVLADTAARAEEVVELIPEDRASWSAGNLFMPITGLFLGGPSYWYGERKLHIETTPPGAELDLFYVRSNFQKAYESAESPVTVLLPERSAAGPRDVVTIRALLDGHRQQEVRVKVRSKEERVMIELEPLPNSLVAVSYVYLAGRGSLTFLTREALTFRIQKAPDGLSVVLTETALAPGAGASAEGVESPLVEGLEPQQLGEDLVMRVALSERARGDEIEARSRQGVDPVRNLHSFGLDLVPSDGGGEGVRRARAALASIRRRDVTGCNAVFDHALREQLDPAALSRALGMRGSFTDPFLRAAMKRLGEVSPDGVVSTVDGSTYRVSIPLELAAASNEAGQVLGYLALLRRFVQELEGETWWRSSLRGLVAPELAASAFDASMAAAGEREARCLASGGQKSG